MTEADLLGLLSGLDPAEAAERLLSLAHEQGSTALQTLRDAAEIPSAIKAAIDILGDTPTQQAWDALERLSRKGGKGPARKLARRAQHRLRSRGFRPATPAPQETSPQVERAQSSFLDIGGDQFMRLVVRAPLGMLRYAGFIASPEGLLRCFYLVAGRRDIEEMLAAQDARFGQDLVEMDLAYIARRVRQAAAVNRERGSSLPEDYLEAARLLEGAPEDRWPEELTAAALGGRVSPNEATDLLTHRSMWGVLPHPEQMAPYARDWLRVLERQPSQTDERVTNLGIVQSRGQLTGRFIGEFYDEDGRRRLQEQLREQSRLLFALGEKQRAAVAVRGAASLDEDPTPGNALLRKLAERALELTVEILEQQEEEEEARRSPWMRAASESSPLWVPRPAEDTGEEEEEPPPRLWLPGQE